jgi:CHAT domain-containing protein
VVKEQGRSYGYLHLASDGVFDTEQPLNSRLLSSKDCQNDGRLTVRELYNLESNANVVTLSACETALVSVVNGDDVVVFTLCSRCVHTRFSLRRCELNSVEFMAG